MSDRDAAAEFDVAEERVRSVVERARAVLYARRRQRVAPATDRKVLADWNGLMIAAMARCGRRLGRDDLVRRALRAADYVRSRMIEDGRLRHFCMDDEPRVPAFLDDYAFLGKACLECFFAGGRTLDFETAVSCAEALLEGFRDSKRGGYFFTTSDSDDLLARTRDVVDGATPSGNAVATELMLRLHELTGDDRCERAGDDALAAFRAVALENPHACAEFLRVLHRVEGGYGVVVIAEPPDDRERAAALEGAALAAGGADLSVARIGAGDRARLPAAIADRQPVEGRSTAYVCRGRTCEAPITEPEALAHALGASSA